ncbi:MULTISPECIES: ead/Ea22-like family protein [unclassified Pseudomonas]|uniref:ead/Ea22-like family protein n=1 Tax=unclassified Pseudomonas TaxID=196821 RepID=UPI002448D985|nr:MULTISPECIES: ead/Ea22-like family protein [unclassified Pseudomonas]MDG9927434.1 ead/Ea22-like family protein [Pseudomonas sp. GD04042]MDH0482503.1 ead/Ea22-like family protein [Pseudomonas sp. GD04015]MDH0602855.1 ead/Ea22-like family protein [Pseudomonas sp. GD03869]
MTDLNKQELRRLAEKATPLVDWYKPGDLRYDDSKTGEVHGLHHDDDSFIAAAGPAAILSLLDEIDRLSFEPAKHSRRLIEQLRVEVEVLRLDAARWQCVRNAIPMQSPYAVWREGSHVVLGKDADEMVDNFLAAKEGNANG